MTRAIVAMLPLVLWAGVARAQSTAGTCSEGQTWSPASNKCVSIEFPTAGTVVYQSQQQWLECKEITPGYTQCALPTETILGLMQQQLDRIEAMLKAICDAPGGKLQCPK